MTTPNTYRIAAAFQAEKDPQQDAVIAWLGALPKDSRGGVKRSVMKYHITRALLLYMQSGADMSTALHIGAGAPAAFQTARPVSSFAPALVATPSVVPAIPQAAFVSSNTVNSDVPVLTDTVQKAGGKLRSRIATSMQGKN